jgi:hypothetical protein
MNEIKFIPYIKDFKKLITKLIAKQNAHKIKCILIGDVEDSIDETMHLYLTQQLIEITYENTTYQMRINQGNKQGIYRNLKRFICLVPIHLYTESKKDGPYTYFRYEKKLKLIRELIDC